MQIGIQESITDAIWFCQPISPSRGCSVLAVALVPAKFGSEKIESSQALPCAITGGATSATVRGGGAAPTRGQYCTHCQSPPPPSKSTICQFSRQPSGVMPSQYGRAVARYASGQ